MSGYFHSRKITCTNQPEGLARGLRWRAKGYRYQVRSDAGGLNTRFDDCETITEARKIAKQRAKACGWAEIFRWAESAVMIRKFFVAAYERELEI